MYRNEKKTLMAVDMGVSFIKTGIYDLTGQCICSSFERVPGEYPSPGVFIQKAEQYFNLVLKAIKESILKFTPGIPDIQAICFSAAMGGALGIDENWNITADWSIISDTRFNSYALKMLDKNSLDLLKLSGTNFPVFAAKLLWWKKEFKPIYKKTKKFLFLNGYIAGKMGNIKIDDVFVDKSHLQWTALADLKNGIWSEDLCSEFDIDKNLLPNIVNSHYIIGKINKNIASQCGLKDGIPIVAGAGDKPAGTVGAGLASNGLLIDESASFASLSLCIDRYIPDIENRTLENSISPVEGFFLSNIFINGSGITHDWFVQAFCDDEKRIAKIKNTNPFVILDERAKNIKPGSDKLLAVGHLGGRGCPFDPDIRGMWINYSWVHQKEHFWRSLLESFAYEFANAINIMKKNYEDVNLNEIRVIGGASKSDVWNQIKSDVTGIPYVRLDRDDLTLLGDVLIAGYGIGIYDNLKEISQKFINKTVKYTPNNVNHKYYKKLTKLYIEVFDRIRKVYKDLKNIPNF